jgi:ketosteroid isomerase-like protein
VSQENVEIVRRFFDALERSLNAWDRSRSLAEAVRRDDLPQESREAFRYLSPEAEWNPIFSSETYRGYVEMAKAWDELLEAAGEYHVKLLDTMDLVDDRVFVVFGPALEGRSTGIHVDAAVFGVVTLRNGLIVRSDEYTNRAEALEAAGLSDQGAHFNS